MPEPATRKDPLANPPDCPYCGQYVTRAGYGPGHVDDCPALRESWGFRVEVLGDILVDVAHEDDDDWREQLREVAGELLAMADWPTKFRPGSLSEAVHLGRQ